MSAAPIPRAADWLMVAAWRLVWASTFLVLALALRGITPL